MTLINKVQTGVTLSSLRLDSRWIILKLNLYLFLFLTVIVISSESLHLVDKVVGPSLPPLERFKREDFGDKELRYLMQYGYLPMSSLETGNLRTEKQVRKAIKTLQRYGNIPQTGKMDAATRALMKRPRCSLPDVPPDDIAPDGRGWQNKLLRRRRKKRFVKQGASWKKFDLSWGLRSFPSQRRERTGEASHPSRDDIRREIYRAMSLWGDVSRLNFHETSESDSADIILDFYTGYHTDGYPFDGPGNTVAHAFYPGEDRGGDIHLDDQENWMTHRQSLQDSNGVSLEVTVAHELGHALGLFHSDVQGALMSPYLLWFPEGFELPQDDRLGIQAIYGAPSRWTPRVWHTSSTTETPPLTTTTTTLPPSPHGPTYPVTRAPDLPSPPSPPRPSGKPVTCDTDFDAISVIRGEIHIFKGKYFWRVRPSGELHPGYPEKIQRFWRALPSNLTSIDAVYERSSDSRIIFFIGPRYYELEGNEQLVETAPIRKFGLPPDLQKLDGAFIWGHNGRTYFFSDTMYWRFEEDKQHVELDYPRDMMMWRGVPYNIDAAFRFNGTTYFFKGRQFYEFDDLRMMITRRSPLLSAPFWFNCPNQLKIKEAVTSGAPVTAVRSSLLLAVLLVTLLLPTSLT